VKIRPVGAELFYGGRRTDGRTDGHDEAHSPFSQFCERAVNFINFIKKKRKKGTQGISFSYLVDK